ncbi:MAG: hypothetical protein LBV80_07980 [Deltaproteobacteria bacterium]|jgi:hypothetical protein|nr:hypothetical protein [Deltaproteobacteria bacterium]
MGAIISAIFSFFSSSGGGLTVVALIPSLIFGGLWLFERDTSQDLAQANGQLIAANTGQALTIAQLRTERAISDKILSDRETDLENIRKKAAADKAGVTLAGTTDQKLADWLDDPLPDYVVGLLGHADSDANQDREANTPGGTAAGDAGTSF